MLLRAELHPHVLLRPPAAAKVHALVEGRVDVAGPKDAEPAALVHVLVGLAAEFKINVMRRFQREGGPAFHVKIRRGRLMQLGGGGIHLAKGHGRPARFKKHISPSKLRLAIEHMLEV